MQTRILKSFPHLHVKIVNYTSSIYVGDYSEATKLEPVRRDVEINIRPFADIEYFTIHNNSNLSIDTIIHDNFSFVDNRGNSKTQCESSVFPTNNTNNSWFLLIELKYSLPKNNPKNVNKAIKQLFKTRNYYYKSGIITPSNTSYLIASLPTQREPFAHFVLTQSNLIKLKVKRKIVLKLSNSIEITSNEVII